MRDHRARALAWLQKHARALSEVDAAVDSLAAEMRAAAEKAEDRLAFTEEWYAVHEARLRDLLKDEHPEVWAKAASIMANGTASATEPPTYARKLNMMRFRAVNAVIAELNRERAESARWRGLYEMRVAAHRREKERALAALGEAAELRERLDEYEVEPGEGTEFQRIADRMIAPSDGISWKPLLDLLAERDRLRAEVEALRAQPRALAWVGSSCGIPSPPGDVEYEVGDEEPCVLCDDDACVAHVVDWQANGNTIAGDLQDRLGVLRATRVAAWAAADARHLALRNVLALAARLRRTDPENAAHLIRFCAAAGVVPEILRAEAAAPPEPSAEAEALRTAEEVLRELATWTIGGSLGRALDAARAVVARLDEVRRGR